MNKKLFCASIYLYQGSAVRNLEDHTIVSDDPAALATYYCNNNADRVIVFDQSNTDNEHEAALDIIKKIALACEVPKSLENPKLWHPIRTPPVYLNTKNFWKSTYLN